jgi:Ca2+-binding EF-hand superfamily protein
VPLASPVVALLGSPGRKQKQVASSPSHGSSVLQQLKDRLASNAQPFGLERLFADWDRDSDHQIDRDEFGHLAISWLGYDVPSKDVNALFDELDTDCNGSLSYYELVETLRRSE